MITEQQKQEIDAYIKKKCHNEIRNWENQSHANLVFWKSLTGDQKVSIYNTYRRTPFASVCDVLRWCQRFGIDNINKYTPSEEEYPNFSSKIEKSISEIQELDKNVMKANKRKR